MERDLGRSAAMFRALGDPTRLRIFAFLRRCCCVIALEESGDARPVDGATVGEICCRVTGAERITSTLSHHLKQLRLAGLITTRRRGQQILCRVNPEAVEALAAFLNDREGEDKTDGCCE
jgi:ArsR family transcriptional regulator